MKRTPIKRSLNTAGDVFDAILDPDFEIIDEDIDDILDIEDLVLDTKFDEITQQMLLSSVAFLAHSILTGPNEPPYNGRFLVSDHHFSWDQLVEDHNRLCILSARDHGKSYFFDFAYPIRQAIKYPKECGFIFSATQSQAEEFLEIVKLEIESNPKLQYLVPKKKTSWGSRKITLANGHRIYARGYGVRVRGAHPVWIVVDDGLNDETAYSETVRNKQNDYFFNAISNMVTPYGQIIVVGTPFHSSDLYGELKKNSQYHYAEYPAESNPGEEDNVILWTDRYSEERLRLKKEEIGTIRYGREFQVNPISDDMSLFPSYLFKGSPVEQFNVVLGLPLSYWSDKGMEIYIGVDFAISSTVQADYTVIVILAVDDFGNRWIVDIFRDKGLPYQAQRSEINRFGRLYDPNLMCLEANQMQRIFGDELIRETDLPIHKYTTGKERNSLEHGIPELRVLLENGKLRIPRGDKDSIEKTDILINELKSMTFLEGKIQSVGAHDDTVLSLWLANQSVKIGGFDFSFGEEYSGPKENVNKAKVVPIISNDDRKQEVWAMIRRGAGIKCTVEEYPNVRNWLHEYAGSKIDTGQDPYAIIALEEVRRLDAVFNHQVN